jgi:hypothetical protein
MKCIKCNSDIFVFNLFYIKCNCTINSPYSPPISFNNDIIYFGIEKPTIHMYKVVNEKVIYLYRMLPPHSIKNIESILNNLIFI